MATTIRCVEVSATGSYCVDGKRYLKSAYKEGTYAAFNDSGICYLLIPASKADVDEYIARFANDKRIEYFHLRQMFNKNIVFSISYFENIIAEKEKSIAEIHANYQSYDNCIANAIEVDYKVIGEGVYKDYVNDTVRSSDVVYSDFYHYLIVTTSINRTITFITKRLEDYVGEHMTTMPYEEALPYLNNKYRMGIKDKYFITYNDKKYYFNK